MERGRRVVDAWTGAAATRALRVARRKNVGFIVVGLWAWFLI
jgi:hypothetical protein